MSENLHFLLKNLHFLLKNLHFNIKYCCRYNPASSHAGNKCGDETQFRYFMGLKIQRGVAAYNSYFDATGADLIIMPAAM